MRELRKRAANALCALLQDDAKTALEELSIYKIEFEDGEPILTPGHLIGALGRENPHLLAGREMWIIGTEYHPGQWGMRRPSPALAAMLAVTGEGNNTYIFHHCADGSQEATYRWRVHRWVKMGPDDWRGLDVAQINPFRVREPYLLAKQEAWAVGIKYSPEEHAMTNGPFPSIVEALDVVGQENSRILHFLGDGTKEVTHLWVDDEHTHQEWVPVAAALNAGIEVNPFEKKR